MLLANELESIIVWGYTGTRVGLMKTKLGIPLTHMQFRVWGLGIEERLFRDPQDSAGSTKERDV